MASRVAKNKSHVKGKGKAGSFSNVSETAFCLVKEDDLEVFEEKCQHRLVVKQHVYKANVVEELNFPNIVSHVEHQKINYFLQLSQDYNEDIIRVFCVGLHKC
ncbi:unnamed protein product [Vicia faba]|uniref:Uncharacterized protein n=1 Tax=Vicia faba TaxID=3906 RepID=A0AAV1AF45_VICFA|nr:unnamed protein product [Vicia faba]